MTISITAIPNNEYLAYILQSGIIRVGTQDLKFIQNIYTITLEGKPVTTNQVFLFNKLVEKYTKQLQKSGLNIEIIKTLKWESKIVPSEKKYTEAYISIENGKIIFRAPFNKNFLSAFRKQENNDFIWDKDNRCQSCDYSTTALKIIITVSHEFYPVVNYCDSTIELLNTLFQYETVKYWTPTLVKSNNNYFIAACNESLLNAISHIKLDSDMHTLDELSRYGVKVDDSITENDIDLKFASSFLASADLANIDDTAALLKLLDYDTAYLHQKFMITHKKFLEKSLQEYGIKVSYRSKAQPDEKAVLLHMLPEFHIQDQDDIKQGISKVVKIKNSIPIELK